jgi:type II secretory pathway component HofQ
MYYFYCITDTNLSSQQSTELDQLSNSSVVITPKSSPNKDQSGNEGETSVADNKERETTQQPECKKV